MTRKTTPYTCTNQNITARIPRKALPCTDARRNPEVLEGHADLGNDSGHRSFPLARSADPAGRAGFFLRCAVHHALLADAGRRADGNPSGTERPAAIRDVFRAAHRGGVRGEPGIHAGIWICRGL